MKKYLVLSLMLLSGVANAACIAGGQICTDDTGMTIQGRPTNSRGEGIPVAAKATINVSTPTATGQLLFCSDCNMFNSGRGSVCVSTGAATAGAYVVISSAAATTQCL